MIKVINYDDIEDWDCPNPLPLSVWAIMRLIRNGIPEEDLEKTYTNRFKTNPIVIETIGELGGIACLPNSTILKIDYRGPFFYTILARFNGIDYKRRRSNTSEWDIRRNSK